MAAEIEVGAHLGFPGSGGTVVAVFMRAMKPAGVSVPIESLDERIKTIAFLLRVSGKFRQFEKDLKHLDEMVGNVKFERGYVSVSVDLVMTIAEWEGKTHAEIARVFAERVAMVPEVLRPKFKSRKLKYDGELLGQELRRFADGFVERAAGLDQ
jgi:hypothetical protein